MSLFQPSNFTPIITVNLTSLLVLTTLFIGISKSLPATSYIKYIDVFLIFSLMMPFAEVLLHTGADVLRNAKKRSEQKQIQQQQQKRAGTATSNIAWEDKVARNAGVVKDKVLKFLVGVGMIGIPLLYFAFVVCFIIYGLRLKGQLRT